jgi:hypothetical protein
MTTTKQMLLEMKYGGDLAGDIAEAVKAGRSWRDIRHDVEGRTGLHVTHESLRQWYKPAHETDGSPA